MVIRSIRPTDVLRVLLANRGIDLDWAQTWERIEGRGSSAFSAACLAKGFILQQERHKTSILAEGMRIRAIASVRQRSGPRAWEVHSLNLSSQIEEECIELLTALCITAASEGCQRVFLRLPAQSYVVNLARRAGFLSCTKETLYRLERPISPASLSSGRIRCYLPTDEYNIFHLYNYSVPYNVRMACAITFDEWIDAQEPLGENMQLGLYESYGSIRGWIRITSDRHSANRIEIVAHPDENSYTWDELLSWGLQQGKPTEPFMSLVPDYQPTLHRILERKGFIPTGEYQLMVRSATVMVEGSALAISGA